MQTFASGREALARRVESVWLRLGGPAACAQEADLGHARAFFDALSQWTCEPDWTGPQELPQRLSRLFATHPAQTGPVVQIMTIHRAKGLEFDHVILPGLGRQRRRPERPLLQWLDLPRGTRGSDLLMVAVPPTAAAGPTALGSYVTRLQDQRERNEATRLLYVAATRARLQLHLFGQLEAPRSEKSAVAPRRGTLLERLWPAISSDFPQQPESQSDTAAPLSTSTRDAATLERLRGGWCLPPLPPGLELRGLPIASYEPAPTPAAASLTQAELAAGRVERAVCEILRNLARRRRVPVRDPDLLAQQLTDRLQVLGCAPDALAQSVATGVELLVACLDDARLQWIFTSLSAAPAAADVPLALTGMFAGRLHSVRADLSFKDQAGTRWLIDVAPQPPRPAVMRTADAALEAAFSLRLAALCGTGAGAGGCARACGGLPAGPTAVLDGIGDLERAHQGKGSPARRVGGSQVLEHVDHFGRGTGTRRHLSLQHITGVMRQLQGGIQREHAARVMHHGGGCVSGAGCGAGTKDHLVVAERLRLGADEILDIQLALQCRQELPGPFDARQVPLQARVCAGRERGHHGAGERKIQRDIAAVKRPTEPQGHDPAQVTAPIGQVHSQCQPTPQQLQDLQVPRQIAHGTTIAGEAGAVAAPRAAVQLLAMHAVRQQRADPARRKAQDQHQHEADDRQDDRPAQGLSVLAGGAQHEARVHQSRRAGGVDVPRFHMDAVLLRELRQPHDQGIEWGLVETHAQGPGPAGFAAV